ncbi:MAG TPA: DUF2235 domain-containing protein [Chloroflexota bacterium]|jgi:uncharacterized protein (DUF2235 family)
MRRLVVCCDGTWNTPDEKDEGIDTCSNVTKLALGVAARDPRGTEQLVFYDNGVGTSALDHWRGGLFGIGLSRKVQDAYVFLVQNYEPGDEIFLFGFSRGAYTVRSTAGFIRNSGLLKRAYLGKLADAYELYRDRSDATHPRAVESRLFRKSFAHEIRIKFIGVWDTVGALGVPDLPTIPAISARWKFHDVTLSSYVDNAFQALAVDERRKPFEPTLWQQEVPAPAQQALEQVWFSGVHTNVGGGYRDSGLSDLALQWMIAKAEICGLAVEGIDAYPNPLGKLRDSMTWYYRLFGDGLRPITAQRLDEQGKPTITNESVAATAKVRWDQDPGYRPPNLGAYLERGGPLTAI